MPRIAPAAPATPRDVPPALSSTPANTPSNTFDALDLALEMIRSLCEPLVRLTARDADLANQVRRAASSVSLNLSEGRRRVGKDRVHFFRIASGSAGEVLASVQVAKAWGHLEADDVATPLTLCDRILAICWKLTR